MGGRASRSQPCADCRHPFSQGRVKKEGGKRCTRSQRLEGLYARACVTTVRAIHAVCRRDVCKIADSSPDKCQCPSCGQQRDDTCHLYRSARVTRVKRCRGRGFVPPGGLKVG